MPALPPSFAGVAATIPSQIVHFLPRRRWTSCRGHRHPPPPRTMPSFDQVSSKLQTRSSLYSAVAFRTHLLRCKHTTNRVIMRRLHRPRHHAQRSTPATAARSPTPSSCRTLLLRGPARPQSDHAGQIGSHLRARRPQSDHEVDDRLHLVMYHVLIPQHLVHIMHVFHTIILLKALRP